MPDAGEDPADAVGPIMRTSVLHLLLIAILGLVVYSNTFHVPFVLDDKSSIVNNGVIRSLDNFFENSSGYDYNPRRVVGYLTFALNYRVGGLEVTGFHVVNLAIHIINAFLVYGLVLLTFRTAYMKGAASVASARWIALVCALLFVAHPLQTQAVTYIVQRLTSLAAMFYLLSLILYARYGLFHEADGPAKGKARVVYGLSLAAVILAMKTKEIAFTIPFVVALYENFFFRTGPRKRLLRLTPFLLTLFIIPASVLNVGKPLGEILSDPSGVTVVQSAVPRGEYLMTQFRVITTYIRLLFFPANQNLDYEYPVYHSIFSPAVILSLAFLLAVAGTGIFLYLRSRSTASPEGRGLRLVSFGIIWFFITLAVESSFIPIVDVIFEHRVYLPSIGAFLAVVAACEAISRRYLAVDADGKKKRMSLLVAVAILLVLSVTTWKRNEIWADNVTLWRDVLEKSPGKARPYHNLAVSLSEAGKESEAIDLYLTATRIAPDSIETYNNLGAAMSAVGRPEDAIPPLMKAIAMKPDYAEAYYNLGRVYLTSGSRSDDAIFMFRRAIELNPDYPDAHVNLAASYIRARRFQEAVRLLESAIPSFPGRPDAHFNLGVAYFCVGNVEGAARELAILRGLDTALGKQLERFVSQSGK